MKVKIKFKNFDGTVVSKEKKISEKDHLRAQQLYKGVVFRDRTKYNRKRKHKKNYQEDEL